MAEPAADMASLPPPPLPPVALPSPLVPNTAVAAAAIDTSDFGGPLDVHGEITTADSLVATAYIPSLQQEVAADGLIHLDGIMTALQSLQSENGGSLAVPSSHPVS